MGVGRQELETRGKGQRSWLYPRTNGREVGTSPITLVAAAYHGILSRLLPLLDKKPQETAKQESRRGRTERGRRNREMKRGGRDGEKKEDVLYTTELWRATWHDQPRPALAAGNLTSPHALD